MIAEITRNVRARGADIPAPPEGGGWRRRRRGRGGASRPGGGGRPGGCPYGFGCGCPGTDGLSGSVMIAEITRNVRARGSDIPAPPEGGGWRRRRRGRRGTSRPG